jgi:hypothetical protein
VTPEQIEAWEAEAGVRLPDVLRQALARQNGGYVIDTQFRILPLEKMVTPDDEFWEFASCDEEAVSDRALLLRFAEDGDLGGELFLNFNAQGPDQEPSVYEYHSDPGDLNRRANSVTKFITRMVETFETPLVIWSEMATLEEIAREKVDLSGLYRASAGLEQVLGRVGETFVLFTQECAPNVEKLTKTTLPGPLAKDFAMIQRHRPDPGTHTLTLQPEESDGIVAIESERTRDGRWKNRTMRGAPYCVQFEATDRGRLEALRSLLFGDKTAGQAQAREAKQDDLERKLAASSPEERQAAMMQMLMQMRAPGSLPSAGALDPKDLPPEAAALHQVLQQKMQEIEKRAQETLARHAVDPEVVRLVNELKRPRPDPREGKE